VKLRRNTAPRATRSRTRANVISPQADGPLSGHSPACFRVVWPCRTLAACSSSHIRDASAAGYASDFVARM
jgi:hypothetical protein